MSSRLSDDIMPDPDAVAVTIGCRQDAEADTRTNYDSGNVGGTDKVAAMAANPDDGIAAVAATCPMCGGTHLDPDWYGPCICWTPPTVATEAATCPTCDGSGKGYATFGKSVIIHEYACPTCHGTGGAMMTAQSASRCPVGFEGCKHIGECSNSLNGDVLGSGDITGCWYAHADFASYNGLEGIGLMAMLALLEVIDRLPESVPMVLGRSVAVSLGIEADDEDTIAWLGFQVYNQFERCFEYGTSPRYAWLDLPKDPLRRLLSTWLLEWHNPESLCDSQTLGTGVAK